MQIELKAKRADFIGFMVTGAVLLATFLFIVSIYPPMMSNWYFYLLIVISVGCFFRGLIPFIQNANTRYVFSSQEILIYKKNTEKRIKVEDVSRMWSLRVTVKMPWVGLLYITIIEKDGKKHKIGLFSVSDVMRLQDELYRDLFK